ncbi:MAG: prepilin-type N-terminal cleavage/methylation domain-containing protein [Candidatus Paceibacterota bacterium]|jgi:type II secretion system protein G
MKKSRGFTLIELLVVIAIIGILSSVVLASLNTARMKSRDTKRMADLGQIRIALEMYYNDHGYYPQSSCGWDCNGYRYSYSSSGWNVLAADLKPYIATLPQDPLNTGKCAPWNTGCYTYAYGNVGKSKYSPGQYDLTAQLEDTSSPYRCTVKHYRFYFSNSLWCGGYSGQIYEASLQ